MICGKVTIKCNECHKDLIGTLWFWDYIRWKLFNRLPKGICALCVIKLENRYFEEKIKEVTGVPDIYRGNSKNSGGNRD